jgi:poly-gamma-glutamate capsule biosynthesis protein CapA/YwtB (metallophosphatase superfamily)
MKICTILFLLFAVCVNAQDIADPIVKSKEMFDPKRPLERELQMSVADGFTLAAVGDCIISRPLSQYAQRDPDFASTVKILKQSDATYGNLETNIFDMRQFKGYPASWEGDWTLVSEPAVAKDLSDMGFDLFSRANNHSMDWGLEGMRETTRWLDQIGLVHAGAGESEGSARAAQFFESSKGRIAIVSMVSSFRDTANALPPHGSTPGRPGVSGLNVQKITVVPKDMMAQLVAMRNSAESKTDNSEPVSLFGQQFEVGTPFHYRYEMNPDDLAVILKNIRQGKQNSDFLIATIHSHETVDENPIEVPAAFLTVLAHAAIDAGADEFAVTGIHHLSGIEIYKGRPIFYGLGNFFWSDVIDFLPADIYAKYKNRMAEAFQHPEKATDADLTALLNASSFNNDRTFQSMIAESRFDHGTLAEIRLYPIDLGYGRKLPESGIPRMASPQKTAEILGWLQKVSAQYGTKISIENNVGIIRP